MISCIYKIVSPTKRVYVGKTKNFERRVKDYRTNLGKGQPALYNSFKKHGFENHQIIIEEYFPESELNEMEIYYIKLFDSIKNGLNVHIGGKGDFGWSIGANREKYMKMLRDRVGDKNPNYGNHYKHTEESIMKMKELAKGKGALGKNSRAKKYLEVETGIVYPCMKSIALKYGVTNSGVINSFRRNSYRCRGKQYRFIE